jgi:hypothetical protein
MNAIRRQTAAFLTCALCSAAAAAADVPMAVEGGRPYIDVQFKAADGHLVKAHVWLDTGGGNIILSEKLAQALGLKPTGDSFHEEGEDLAPLPLPGLELGGQAVKLADVQAFEIMGQAGGVQHTDADAALPVRALRGYDVVFDYPNHRFALNASGGKHSGTEVPVKIGESGMPTVTAQVAGKPYGFLLDTGGTSVMLSQAAIQPDFQHVQGAYGRGNMLLGKFEGKLMTVDIPSLSWGPFQLTHVIAVSRPAGIYEKNMSSIAGADIVGSLGGNVFQHFRIDIDYPKAQLYLTEDKAVKPAALDMVGLMLEPAQGGGYDVAGVQGDVGGIAVGDHLLKVGDVDATQAPLQTVIAALSGKPGESRTLTVQRGDKALTLVAPVQHLLGAKD